MLQMRTALLAAVRLRIPSCRNCVLLQHHHARPTPLRDFHITATRNFACTTRTYNEVQQTVTVTATDILPSATDAATTAIDPPFVEMGLGGGFWPYQWIQSGMEWIYVTTGSPWWLTIIAGTLFVRTAMLPIYIKTRKHMVHIQNKGPGQQKLLNKLRDAQMGGTFDQQMHAAQKLRGYMKVNKTGPIRNLLFNLPMPVLFMSMMMALRQMATVPVPSLEATRFLWLESLCSPDPYYILPLATGSLLGLSLHIGFRSGMVNIPASLQKFVRAVPYIPAVGLPLLLGKWSSGLALYMLINTTFTLSSVWILQHPEVKRRLNFPVLEPNATSEVSIKEAVKDMWDVTKERSRKKQELSDIKAMKKKKAKERKKALSKPPPVTYKIGSEAVYKRHVPDFEAMWNNKPPNIYDQKVYK